MLLRQEGMLLLVTTFLLCLRLATSVEDDLDFCTHNNWTNGVYPHPTDCHSFIECLDLETRYLTCPAEMTYNADLQQCNESNNLSCNLTDTVAEPPSTSYQDYGMLCPTYVPNMEYAITAELYTFPTSCSRSETNLTFKYQDQNIMHCQLETQNCTFSLEYEHLGAATNITLQDTGISRGVQLRVEFMSTAPYLDQFSIIWSLCDGNFVVDSCQVLMEDTIGSVQEGTMLCPTAVTGQDYVMTTQIFTSQADCDANVTLYYGDSEIVQCEGFSKGCLYSADYAFFENSSTISFQKSKGLLLKITVQPEILFYGQYTAKWTTCDDRVQTARCQVETQAPEAAPQIDVYSYCAFNKWRNGNHPHPSDCHSYINCDNFTTEVVSCPQGMVYSTNYRACAMAFGTDHCPDQRPATRKFEMYCPRLISGEYYTITSELLELPSSCHQDFNVTLLYNNKELLQCNSANICQNTVDYSSLGYNGQASISYLGNNSALQFKFEALPPMRGGHYDIKWHFCDGIYQHGCQVFSEGPRTECSNGSVCEHATQCVDGPLGYNCLCLPGYSGVHCNIGDFEVYCTPSLINLPTSNATSMCLRPVSTSCFVAGLPTPDLLVSRPLVSSDHYGINETSVVSDDIVSFTFCLSPDTTPGNLTFYSNVSSRLHGSKPFQIGFKMQVFFVNTAPFFTNSTNKPIGQNKTFSMNVLEHSTNQSTVLCVNKTNDKNGTCDVESGCVQVVDVDKDKRFGIESLRLTVKFNGIGQAMIQFKNGTDPRSFGCFYVKDSLTLTTFSYDLKVNDGGNASANLTVKFTITDENDPPVCWMDPFDLGDIGSTLGNQSVATITCYDPDVYEKFKEVTFVIEQPYQKYFDVTADRHLETYMPLGDLPTGRHTFNITATGYSETADPAYVTILTVTFVVTDMVCPNVLFNEDYTLIFELHSFPHGCRGGVNATLLQEDQEIVHCDLENDTCTYANEFDLQYGNVSFTNLKLLGNNSGLQFKFESPDPVLQEGLYTVRWRFCDGTDTRKLCYIKSGAPVDECALGSPCVFSTWCTDQRVGYTCHCLPGYDGQNCDVGDYKLYCDPPYVILPPSTADNTCFPSLVSCYVAGLNASGSLSLSAYATVSLSSLGLTDNITLENDLVTFTLCLTSDSLEGEHNIIYNISSSVYGDRPFQVEFNLKVLSVNTVPFFSLGQNAMITFNVSEHTAVNTAVLCVNKTSNKNQSCDAGSRCVLIVDVDKNVSYGVASLKLTAKFSQGQQVIQFENETTPGSFGCFYVQGILKPTPVYYKLTVTDGGYLSATSSLQIIILDENDPPSCYNTYISLGNIDISVNNLDLIDIDCRDPDYEAQFKQITYLVDPPYNNYFRVSGSNMLQVYNSLNGLALGSHIFNITATGYSISMDSSYITNITVNLFLTVHECPVETFQEEITFQNTPIGKTYAAPCPKDYKGTITRRCSMDMTWEEFNLNNCSREDLISALDLVSALDDPEMSSEEATERVENATVLVINSLVSNPVIVSGDIKNILNVFMSVRNSSKHHNAAVNTVTLQNFADISDKLMAANDTSWSDLKHEDANYGSVLLDSLDTIATTSLKSLSEKESITVKDNIVIGRYIGFDEIQFPGPDANKITYGWVIQADNKVYLPRDAFDGPVNYTIIVYRNMASKIIINNTLQERHGESILINKVFNSDIISISTSQKSIQKPIQLTFLLTQTNFSQPVCAFLSTSASVSDKGLWSTQGCVVIASNRSHIICSCNHLTSFAVLMSPFTPDDSFAISLISQIGCGISIFCLLLTVVVYGVMWRYVKNDRSVLHVNLCLCLIVGYVVFLAGVDQTENEIGCKVVAAFLHYFFLVVFFTMFAEGIEIFKSVKIVFMSKSFLTILLLSAYGVPLVIVAVSIGITRADGYGTEKYCWLALDGGLFWAFVGPVLFVFFVNLLVLIVVIKVMQTSHWMKGKKKRTRIMSVIRSICVLFPLMGLTWIFGVLSVNHETVVFQYLFAIFNSLQGLFVFIFHCLLHYQIRDGFKAMKSQRQSAVTSIRTSTTDTDRRTSHSTTQSHRERYKRRVSTKPETGEAIASDKKLRGVKMTPHNEESCFYSDREEGSEFNFDNAAGGHPNGSDYVDTWRQPGLNEISDVNENTPIIRRTAQKDEVENIAVMNPMFEMDKDNEQTKKRDSLHRMTVLL